MRRIFLIFFLSAMSLVTRIGLAQTPATSWMIAAQALRLLNAGPALGAFLQKSAQRGVDPNFVYGVLQNARELDERGLPTEPYLLKANEGLAKGIPPTQIRPALEGTRRWTERAESLVDGAQARGLVFSNPQQRRLAIQEYQWVLMREGPYPGPGNMKAWKGGQLHPKNHKHSDKMYPGGPQGRPWGAGKKGHGKNK